MFKLFSGLFHTAPEYSDDIEYYDQFCPNCNADLCKQKGFTPDVSIWECRSCGAILTNPDAEELEDSPVIWQCDTCGDYLNLQEGFTGEEGVWKCTKCGADNTIGPEEIYENNDEYHYARSNPTRGLSTADVLELMRYSEVKRLDEDGRIVLTRDSETGRLYVKKALERYDLSVYEALREHPIEGMPRIEALFRSNRFLIVIEEYMEGKTLAERLENGPVAPETAIDIMSQLCDIVATLHGMQPAVIHRDIKPANVIWTADGRVFLLDIDAAKNYKPGEARDTVLIGTREYAAPEQYGFGASSVRTDIYALGVLLNELLTGKKPKDETAPGYFGDIVTTCTRIDPEDRYPDVITLKRELLQ